jgi:hypothetical protein
MYFSHSGVASTCTCSHVVGWSVTMPVGSPKQVLEGKLAYVNQLAGLGFKQDFKMIIATITQQQMNSSNGFIEEFMKEIGWAEVLVGPVLPNGREKGTGALHLYAISPKEYKEGIEGYQQRLKAALKDLKKGPLDAKELADRQSKPELLIINLKRNGLIKVDCKRIDTKISEALVVGRPVATLITHIRMRYGVDFNEVFEGKTAERTLREMKEYHAGWRAGTII